MIFGSDNSFTENNMHDSVSSGHFRRTVQEMLVLLRQAVNSRSAILIKREQKHFSVFASTSEVQLSEQTVSVDSGILASLKSVSILNCPDLTRSAYKVSLFSSNNQPNSLFALNFSIDSSTSLDTKQSYILYVDRKNPTSWDADICYIQALVNSFIHLFSLSKSLFISEAESYTYKKAFTGLKEIGDATDLSSVLKSAATAIQSMTNTDLVCYSLVGKNCHRPQILLKNQDESLPDIILSLEGTLAGQAVKYREPITNLWSPFRDSVKIGLPELANFSSTYIYPIIAKDKSVLGLLFLGLQDNRVLNQDILDLVQIISSQVALKIDLIKTQEKIKTIALTDPLTGIPNRRAFEKAFQAIHQRSERHETSYALIICDIDHFKLINDTYGHPFGDEVLINVSKLLQKEVRGHDMAARIGGEEFAIILENIGINEGYAVAERIRLLVEGMKIKNNEKTVPVTISLGVTSYPENGTDRNFLFKQADRMLYSSKTAGRNRVSVFKPSAKVVTSTLYSGSSKRDNKGNIKHH